MKDIDSHKQILKDNGMVSIAWQRGMLGRNAVHLHNVACAGEDTAPAFVTRQLLIQGIPLIMPRLPLKQPMSLSQPSTQKLLSLFESLAPILPCPRLLLVDQSCRRWHDPYLQPSKSRHLCEAVYVTGWRKSTVLCDGVSCEGIEAGDRLGAAAFNCSFRVYQR